MNFSVFLATWKHVNYIGNPHIYQLARKFSLGFPQLQECLIEVVLDVTFTSHKSTQSVIVIAIVTISIYSIHPSMCSKSKWNLTYFSSISAILLQLYSTVFMESNSNKTVMLIQYEKFHFSVWIVWITSET